jgi:hypothetical protein
MPERQHHAKIANEMANRLQRSADVPRWNKSERQAIEEWAEDHEMTWGSQAGNVRSEPRCDEGNHSRKPPRTPVYAVPASWWMAKGQCAPR